ncbi:MAG: OmpH family outer membrane protein [Rhodobacteraceae bacterium]|jgi:Skp family chaperone for outer membrane proteins|uniref:OmpH family outer membrane protein n=1 Tax=Albidovulum sp. TaxID=1872424 RepID=UPI001D4563E4|nr:OmpH family outer membrane protein [uncultured Defluviimonas sp.]MCB2126502.1 OmpH family outer membrane protein [Paracoccaceae bacterium]MCC0068664.1 OmpH family outer membrane protein [Paracoccaceae bacterium]
MRAPQRLVLALAFAAGVAFPAFAQETEPAQGGLVQTPILTIDQDQLFGGTLWGKRVAARIEAASADLAAENRRIEAELTAEEKALTEKRPTLPPEDFRRLADSFDARVTEFRNSQDRKARAIARIHDAERQAFFQAALPVMAEVLRGHGAIAVLDNRAIFLAADAIDATDEMIARIDAELGPGADVAVPEEAEGGETAPAPGARALPAPDLPGSGN